MLSLAAVLSGCTGGSGEAESATATSIAPTTAAPAPTTPAPVETMAPAASPTSSAAAVPEALTCSDTLVAQTEGPYYTPDAPERTDVTDKDTVGIPLTLTGYVLDDACAPVAGTSIEFWQADGAGVYDNEGFRLRGAQVTDDAGAYSLRTVIPGVYPSRTEHIHVKVTGPDGTVHTTQLYFPDVPRNDDDRFFSDTMLVTVEEQTDEGMTATFDFVLP